MLIHQRLKRRLAANHGVANFLDAARAQAVGLAREAERSEVRSYDFSRACPSG